MFRIMAFAFSIRHYMWWTLAFLGMVEHLPVLGKWWTKSCVALIACEALLYLLNCLCLNLHVFSLFWFSPHPTITEQLCGAYLPLWLNHDSCTHIKWQSRLFSAEWWVSVNDIEMLLHHERKSGWLYRHKEDGEAYCLELLDYIVLCLKTPLKSETSSS